MSLDKSHLDYPMRRYGMDHERYTWSQLHERQPLQWPGGKATAVWVNVSLQFFPINQQGKPFAPPGGMTMPYPDLRHFSLRDYGNRVGVFRFLKAFKQFGIPASYAINARLAERYPALLNAVLESGGEILGHGWHMDAPHFGGQDIDDERELVANSLAVLRKLSGQPVSGWLSPGKSQSENTPELLAEQGIEYHCDWVNDDLPYTFNTEEGALVSLPLSTELEDRFVIQNNLHSEASWAEQVIDAADFLIAEAKASGGGRMLTLNLHPWLTGQPHRIGFVEQVLANLAARDEVWLASPAEIVSAWQNQNGSK